MCDQTQKSMQLGREVVFGQSPSGGPSMHTYRIIAVYIHAHTHKLTTEHCTAVRLVDEIAIRYAELPLVQMVRRSTCSTEAQ